MSVFSAPPDNKHCRSFSIVMTECNYSTLGRERMREERWSARARHRDGWPTTTACCTTAHVFQQCGRRLPFTVAAFVACGSDVVSLALSFSLSLSPLLLLLLSSLVVFLSFSISSLSPLSRSLDSRLVVFLSLCCALLARRCCCAILCIRTYVLRPIISEGRHFSPRPHQHSRPGTPVMT